MAEASRKMCMAAISNVKKFLDDGEWERATVSDLEARADRLRQFFDKFIEYNATLMSATESEDEKQGHQDLFVAQDKECAELGGRLNNCIAQKRAELRRLQMEAAAENEQIDLEEDGDDGSSIHNGQGGHGSRRNSNASFRSVQGVHEREPVREEQQRAAQAHPPLARERPIYYVNCKNDSVQNTWGEYDGDELAWQGFHDRFKAAVHDNPNIPKVFKFQHLFSSLTGKAKKDIGQWPQSEAGYDELWERLTEMFDRKYETSLKVVSKFYDLPKLDKPNAFMLKKLCNTTHEVLRTLRTMKYPVDKYDLFIVCGLHERLDAETSKAWQLERQSERPTTKEMLEFLDRQAKANVLSHHQSNDNRKRASTSRDGGSAPKQSKPNVPSASNSGTKANVRSCKVCNGNHPVHQCTTFRKMNFSERKKCAKEKELCFNCLSPSHTSRDCQSSSCRRCPGKKHNSLLCNENPLNRSVNQVSVKQVPKPQKNEKVKKGESQ